MSRSIYIAMLLLFLATSCSKDRLFKELGATQTNLNFKNQLQPNDDVNIIDYLYFYNGGGVSVGDINNDGLADIYFTSNQGKNKLFLNKGALKFEDITDKAGVAGSSDWNTGTVMADVNGDGYLDIYVCAVVGIHGLDGYNELFINNGDGTFTEKAAAYGLDFDNYSSVAVFFDYDLDGDLDAYLLNHAVHTEESFGNAQIRNNRKYESGDKLLRNDNNKFIDVSDTAGIFGGVNGYGLGVSVSDFNQDGYPDIYVGNDFHEDDYYYLNNGDGTFSECLRDFFGHTSRFSMGNDVADINHDGFPDILSLDMLPADEIPLKRSEGDDNITLLKMRTERLGYHYQFTRNMLQINEQGGNYKEVALLSGIAASDWSWGALFGDYDQDGEQDIFIANGIPKRPNDLDYIRFISNEEISKKINTTKLIDQEALRLMPSGAVNNYVFKGNQDLRFENMSGKWISKDTIISNGSAYADFDNDGDLDIITNNLNSTPVLYENQAKNNNHFLKIQLKYTKGNTTGLGTKVFAYADGVLQYKEQYTSKGFQSSSTSILHLGFKENASLDSLLIVWPNKRYQKLTDVKLDQMLSLSPSETDKLFDYTRLHQTKATIFKKIDPKEIGLDYTHTENRYIDFNRQKLIPYQISDRGPAIAVGDLNGDQKEDIFLGGSRFYSSKVFYQKDTLFNEEKDLVLAQDSITEDVTATIQDFNNDKINDLFVVSGGGEFFNKAKPLLDRYYKKQDSTFVKTQLPEYFENGSIVVACDYDNDGDIDVFIGGAAVSYNFGKIPKSYLLENDQGAFKINENVSLSEIGMVTDAVWTDFDNDNDNDLIVIGEWMSPLFFENNNGELKNVSTSKYTQKLNGLWQRILPFDIDKDGDMDYLLGNWGLNTKFKASETYPIKMYYADFDGNLLTETILATAKNKKYYPIHGLDELAGQIESLRKKFPVYADFAGKTIEEIIDKEQLDAATVLEVHQLASGYLKNEGGTYTFTPFEDALQVAPITAFLASDFDNDNEQEVLVGGNYFGVIPYHSRFDSFSGALIENATTIIPGYEIGVNFAQKAIRHLNKITLNNQTYIIATINNAAIEVYKLNEN